MIFFPSQTMSHAAYVYDIEHVIVDNLQFMTSYLRYVFLFAFLFLLDKDDSLANSFDIKTTFLSTLFIAPQKHRL